MLHQSPPFFHLFYFRKRKNLTVIEEALQQNLITMNIWDTQCSETGERLHDQMCSLDFTFIASDYKEVAVTAESNLLALILLEL